MGSLGVRGVLGVSGLGSGRYVVPYFFLEGISSLRCFEIIEGHVTDTSLLNQTSQMPHLFWKAQKIPRVRSSQGSLIEVRGSRQGLGEARSMGSIAAHEHADFTLRGPLRYLMPPGGPEFFHWCTSRRPMRTAICESSQPFYKGDGLAYAAWVVRRATPQSWQDGMVAYPAPRESWCAAGTG